MYLHSHQQLWMKYLFSLSIFRCSAGEHQRCFKASFSGPYIPLEKNWLPYSSQLEDGISTSTRLQFQKLKLPHCYIVNVKGTQQRASQIPTKDFLIVTLNQASQSPASRQVCFRRIDQQLNVVQSFKCLPASTKEY